MSFYKYYLNELTTRGLFEEHAEEVLRRCMNKNDSMKDRWDEPIDAYPHPVLITLWFNVKDEALDFIKETCPEAWFRPIFEMSVPEGL